MTVGVIAEYIESGLVPGTTTTIVPNVTIKILFAYGSITTITSSETATTMTTIVSDKNTNYGYYSLLGNLTASTGGTGTYTSTQYVLGTGVQIVISLTSGNGNGYIDIVYMELE